MASCSTNACCTGWSCPPCASPSIVVTFRPRASRANVMQLATTSPSSQTVQAEQAPRSQPIFVPVSPSASRSTSTRVVAGSADAHGRPLTESVNSPALGSEYRRPLLQSGGAAVAEVIAWWRGDRCRACLGRCVLLIHGGNSVACEAGTLVVRDVNPLRPCRPTVDATPRVAGRGQVFRPSFAVFPRMYYATRSIHDNSSRFTRTRCALGLVFLTILRGAIT